MRKTFLISAILVLAVAATAVMAGRGGFGQGYGQGSGPGYGVACPYGGPGGGAGRSGQCPYDGTRVEGKVASINYTDKSFVLDTADGQVTVVVTNDTIIKIGRNKATFDDIKAGQTIRACGELKDKTLTAWVVTIRYRGSTQ